MSNIYKADAPIWFAEDLPGYRLRTAPPKGMTDEDYEMSKPNILIRGVTRREAAAVIAGHLRGIAKSQPGTRHLYWDAAELLINGADAVQLQGRIFRIRRDDEG